jgi:colicin import membrane protein
MFNEFLKNPRALVYAVLVHVTLLLILVMSLKWNTKPTPLQGSGEIVKAVVIDEAKLQEEKKRKLQEEQRKRNAEEAKRRTAEQRRQAELQKQHAAEQRQREAQQAAEKKKRLIADQKRQAKIKADKEAKERQRIAEQKRQAELEVKRKAAAEAEAKRKAEEKRKADEARRQRENLEMMKQQMEQEEADRVAQARAEQQRRELAAKLNQYALQLKNIVDRNWIRPPTARVGLICTVHVRMIPGGTVVDARVTKSSGDAAFDHSAETAVLKSSPLPTPPDPSLREFDFIFNPEG